MTSALKNKIARWGFILLVIGGVTFLLFNDSGYFKYMKLKKEAIELKEELNEKELENKNLEAEVDSLEKKNPNKIERIAREKYGMMKKGEKIIKIEEK
ncbi:MAG: septum formation initiator family protein [Ignavibacteriaceae bacterium]|nr:septum formation initiator family protein [Ignavibacteriaceae bacterium]